MINYNFPLYRPPAEANSIILQATYGCSHNNCTFCSMYKTKKYGIRDIRTLFSEIDHLAKAYPDTKRVFLADGDALSLPTEYLLEVLDYLQNSFKQLRRISLYATAQNILQKSEKELRTLYENKLSLIYFGVETGDEILLQKIHKGVNASEIVTALNRAHEAKLKTSVTVILGLGGLEHTATHIENTAKLINRTKVTYLSTLQLGLDEQIKGWFLKQFENFHPLSDLEVLDEQRRLVSMLKPTNQVIFRSNHASNALHLAGTLPKDRDKLLLQIEKTLKRGEPALVPQHLRGF